MNFEEFEKESGVIFNNKKLLQIAFTHRSYVNEHRNEGKEHNERLEFLGDAVLELSITDYLYKAFPEKTEGDLTAYRSSLVNATTLSQVGAKLNFNKYLLLSKGESRDVGRARQYILANTFEAIVGAIYLDQGYDVANKFITENIVHLLHEIVEQGLWIDAKSSFQEKSQESISVTPSYKTVVEEGPDHDKHFTVAVFLGDEKVAEGRGKSKQEAEQDAARNALQVKNWI